MTKGPNPIPVRAAHPKPSGVPFVRVCFAEAQRTAFSDKANRRSIEEFLPQDDAVAREIVARAAAVAGSTTGLGWAAELARQSFGQFLADLQPYSGAARLIQQATPAILNADQPVNYPSRNGAAKPPGFVTELGAIPVTSAQFVNTAVGPSKKMAHIVAWSREVGKRSDAEAIFERMLKEDVAAGVDSAMFSTAAASSSTPAGLINGVTALVGYVGGDRAALNQDLTALSDAVATGGSGRVTFCMAPQRAMRLRILAPDLVPVLDIAPSAAIPAGRVIAVDGPALIVGTDPEPDLYASQEALVHMSDTPLAIVTGGVAADPVRSLWQTATLALRVIHEIAFAKRRATAAAYVDNASW